MNRSASEMGIEPIEKLLIKHAVPSSLVILVMSLNILIDTVYQTFGGVGSLYGD